MEMIVETIDEHGNLVEVPETPLGATAAATPAEGVPPGDSAPPAPDAAPADSPTGTDTAPAADTTDETDETDRAEVPRGVQRRIDGMRRQLGESERAFARREAAYQQELAELRGRVETLTQLQRGDTPPAPVQPPAAPQPDAYDTQEAYLEALVDYRTTNLLQQAQQERTAQEAQTQQMGALQAREATLRQQHPDYDAQVGTLGAIGMTRQLYEALLSHEVGPDLAYHLARHPEEVQRIAPLQPLALMRELGKLEARLLPPSGPARPSTALSDKPAPLTPVGSSGGGAPVPNVADAGPHRSQKDWIADYEKTYGPGRSQR